MKELLILSGKGGTGKTTIASAFIQLGKIKAYADCDVDAPNLDILLKGDKQLEVENYKGMEKALIDSNKCINCGLCEEHCAFNAIEYKPEMDSYLVDNYACEGCSVCERLCPEGAISMIDNIAGELMLYKNSEEVFSTARLKIGEGNSGLLVTQVKERLRENISNKDLKISIIDGSPGIGCPVIASINDVDMVLIVAEPSVSGMADMKRIVETANGFGKEILICINKYDVNRDISEKIKDYADREEIQIVGKIPYDVEIVNLLNAGKTATEGDSKGIQEIRKVYENTMDIFTEKRESVL